MSIPILNKSRFKFHGGVHPVQHKSCSNKNLSQKIRPSKLLYIPLQQSSVQAKNINKTLVVQKGQIVNKGQPLTSPIDDFYSPIHTPCDGAVKSIELKFCGHPSGKKEAVVVIEAESDTFTPIVSPESSVPPESLVSKSETVDYKNWQEYSNLELLNIIKNAGIVGLGGATFPTFIKQNISLHDDNGLLPTLIVNAMECEPYITCDDRLMREECKSIIQGALISAKLTGCKNIVFATEDNKNEAIRELEKTINELKGHNENINMSILVAPTIYPSGSEKQLIQLVTGKELSKNQLPCDHNLLVQNIATLFAVYQAVIDKHPLTERLITVTGDLVKNAGNYWIPFGTLISDITKLLNIDTNQFDQYIMGGPMMGEKYTDLSIPVSKKTNCLIFNKRVELKETKECIRCGECNNVCPINLLPQQLYWFSKTEQWGVSNEYQINACIECGACDYVCPSNIPLVDYFQYSKSEIRQKAIREKASQLAKNRFEFRLQRLDRIKLERQLKKQKADEERKKVAENNRKDPDGKKAAILAALNRVKKKANNKGSNNEA